MKIRSYVLLTALLYNQSILADANTNSLKEAMEQGKTGVSFRLRHENAHQSGLSTAKATTLRTKIGFESGKYADSTLHLELVDVSNFFGRNYNANVEGLRKPNFATISDPKGTGITQANITHFGLQDTKIILGRQYVLLDNERFIGNDNFRQYPQSFDAIALQTMAVENITFFYSYVNNVNTTKANPRIVEEGRRKLHTHLVNAKWSGFKHGDLIGYVYFNKDKDIRTNSHVILGARAVADDNYKQLNDWGYTIEVARQQTKFNNPITYKAYYILLEGNKKINQFNLDLGYERLGGDKDATGKKFITPLGSNHKFMGWTDTFEITPDKGIQDFYAKAVTEFNDIKINLGYHVFRFAKGSSKAGTGIDVGAGMNLNENVSFNAAYAKFNPASRANLRNTRRVWATLNAVFM